MLLCRIEFFDELTLLEEDECSQNDDEPTRVDKEEEIHLPEVGDFATKVLRLSGFTIDLNNTDGGKEGKGKTMYNSTCIVCTVYTLYIGEIQFIGILKLRTNCSN